MERNLVFPVFNVYVFIMLVVNIVYLILIDINNKCIEYKNTFNVKTEVVALDIIVVVVQVGRIFF
mgnify:CR=1 FL=1